MEHLNPEPTQTSKATALNKYATASFDFNDRYVTEKEASTLTSLSVAWFQRARWSGNGPPYIKAGRSVRYRMQQLVAWMESQQICSTTDKKSTSDDDDSQKCTRR